MALTVDEENFCKALFAGTAPGLTLAGPLRVNNPIASTTSAVFIDNPATVTAVQIVNGATAGNPCLKCVQPPTSNSACVELDQGDGEDALVALGADIRAEQFIADGAAPHLTLKPGGSIQGSLLSDTAPSPEYYDLIRWDGVGALDFKLPDGRVVMRISARGVEIPERRSLPRR